MVFLNNVYKNTQKKRFFKKSKHIKLVFGDIGFIIINEGRIELIQLSLLKKFLKLLINKFKDKKIILKEKIWFFLKPNFYLQQKSKNSRMGKGKGLIQRKTIRVRNGSTFLEFLGVPLYRLNKIIHKVKKIFGIDLIIFSDKIPNYTFWCNQNKYLYFNKKYLSIF